MAASGSVFAKQFAGKIRQVGPDGDLTRKPQAAAQPKSASAKAQIAAPSTKAKSAPGVANPKAKPKAKAAVEEPPPEQDEEEGGVMKCANRDILRQMLRGAKEDDAQGRGLESDAEDAGGGDLSMSTRLVPGTPKAGTLRRIANVPTLTSPAGNKAPQSLLAPMRAVTTVSAPTLAAPTVKAVSSTASANAGVPTRVVNVGPAPDKPKGNTVTIVSGKAPTVQARPAVGATPGAPQGPVTGPPSAGVNAVSKVSTAAPRASISALNAQSGPPLVTSSPIPKSRPVTPSNGVLQVGTPTAKRGGGTPMGGRAGSSYAQIHSRATATPEPKGGIRCGASAFDMLKEREAAEAAKRAAAEEEAEEQRARDNDAGSPRLDDSGFVMPPGSDCSEEDHEERMGDVDASPPAQARNVPSSERAGSASSSGPREANRGATEAPANESAADYVERVKRQMAGNASPPVAPKPTLEPVAAPVVEKTRPQRPRSSDIAGTSSTPAHPPATPPESAHAKPPAKSSMAQVRSRSSDARDTAASVPANAAPRSQSKDSRPAPTALAKAAAGESSRQPQVDDDDDSDDDDVVPIGRAGSDQPWKLDVKAMVKDFAREERAREKAQTRPSAGAPKVQAQRPPKAPSACAPVRQYASDLDEEKPSQQQENVAPGEQLFFSKKPREVDYEPASINDFKQKGYDKREISKLGKLGPDLDDEALLMKKAVQEKTKQFSKELAKINRSRAEVSAKSGPKPEPKAEPKPTARAKAQEFAKNVPKPKVLPTAKQAPAEKRSKEAANGEVSAAKELEFADLDDIARREKQHFEDVRKVQEIKQYLSQLPH